MIINRLCEGPNHGRMSPSKALYCLWHSIRPRSLESCILHQFLKDSFSKAPDSHGSLYQHFQEAPSLIRNKTPRRSMLQEMTFEIHPGGSQVDVGFIDRLPPLNSNAESMQ